MTFKRIDSLQDPLFWAIAELYVECFPNRAEREPLGSIASWIDPAIGVPAPFAGRRSLLAAVEEDRLLGFTWSSYHESSQLGYLRHIAVDPVARESGVGRALVDATRSQFDEEPVRALVLEVERFELATDETDRERRARRIRFFERQGAVTLSLSYTQPALGPDRDPAPLGLYGFLSNTDDREEVVRDFLIDVLRYDPSDPVFAETLAGIIPGPSDKTASR